MEIIYIYYNILVISYENNFDLDFLVFVIVNNSQHHNNCMYAKINDEVLYKISLSFLLPFANNGKKLVTVYVKLEQEYL